MKRKDLTGPKVAKKPQRRIIAEEPQEPVAVSESRYGIQYLTLHSADILPSQEDIAGREYARYAEGEYLLIQQGRPRMTGFYASVHLPNYARMLEFSVWYQGMVDALLHAIRLEGGSELIAQVGYGDTPRATMGMVGPIPVSHTVNNAIFFYVVMIRSFSTADNIKAVQIKYELPLS